MPNIKIELNLSLEFRAIKVSGFIVKVCVIWGINQYLLLVITFRVIFGYV